MIINNFLNLHLLSESQGWHRSRMSPISASDRDRSEGDRYFFDLILSMIGLILETSSDRSDFLETRPTREPVGITDTDL